MGHHTLQPDLGKPRYLLRLHVQGTNKKAREVARGYLVGTVLAALRPGILGVWTNDGAISHEDTMQCLTLMGQEVLPALRDIAKELDLTDPFRTPP